MIHEKAAALDIVPVPGSILRWRSVFADRGLEQAFRARRFNEQKRLALVLVTVVTILPQLQLYREIDLYLQGNAGIGPLIIDRLSSIVVGVGMVAYFCRVRSQSALEITLSMYGLFMATVNSLATLHYPGANIMATTSIVGMVAAVYFFAPLPLIWVTVVATALSVGGELTWGVLRPEQTWFDAFRLALWLVGINVVGFSSCNAVNRTLRELYWRELQLAQQTAQTEAAYQREKIAFDRFRQFAVMISHEFRNPLAIVKNKSQLLQLIRDVGGPEDPEALAAIERAADRLDMLFSQWLTHDRLSEGDIAMDIQEWSMAEIFQMIQREAPVSAPHPLALAAASADLMVRADLILLRLVVHNLIENAIKYSPGGGAIEIWAETKGGEAIIFVRDHGQGIAPKHLDKVFEKYFRASHDSGVRGFGIGLFLVRNLMTLQGGDVSIISTLGQGTTVALRLPLAHRSGPGQRTP